ncbi:16083_t:CDS:1 [Racocetra persica]|uniref:16083_t:CDS:1 n=1 Tax=Racocetra persica TaxID=160502 RepID=A0ACA9MLY5_9GLOM|nr:16083_t:CDS:1 [Racocetra persica]
MPITDPIKRKEYTKLSMKIKRWKEQGKDIGGLLYQREQLIGITLSKITQLENVIPSVILKKRANGENELDPNLNVIPENQKKDVIPNETVKNVIPVISKVIANFGLRPGSDVIPLKNVTPELTTKKVEPELVETIKRVEQKPKTIKISRIIPDEFLVKSNVPRKNGICLC